MDDFERAIEFVLGREGGYVNRPADPGGETNWGISKAAYPHLDIASLTREQAVEIYRRDYWLPSGASELDWPLCLLVLDTAILHGVGAARSWLAECGPNPYAFAAKRLSVYTHSKNWSVFGAGWTNRVAALLAEIGR